jgi:hypothetical protein
MGDLLPSIISTRVTVNIENQELIMQPIKSLMTITGSVIISGLVFPNGVNAIDRNNISTLQFNQDRLLGEDNQKNSPKIHPRLALEQWADVICSGGNYDTVYLSVETKGYMINICGNSTRPTHYISYDYKRTKKPGKSLILPLTSYSKNNYTAASGPIRYTVNRKYLTVTRNGRKILNEKVIRWDNTIQPNSTSSSKSIGDYPDGSQAPTTSKVNQLPKVGTLKDLKPDVTGCSFFEIKNRNKQRGTTDNSILIMTNDKGVSTWMNLDGRDTELRKVSEQYHPKKGSTENYSTINYLLDNLKIKVVITYRQGKDCDGTCAQSAVTMTLNSKSKTIKAEGVCGD